MELQEATRAEVQGRRRLKETGQTSFLSNEELHSPVYYQALRERYVGRSKALVQDVLEERKRVPYDDVWDIALSQPMTWESDLKAWVRQWQDEGMIKIEGMRPRQRVPHLDECNVLLWT
jgi:hypothetical protein